LTFRINTKFYSDGQVFALIISNRDKKLKMFNDLRIMGGLLKSIKTSSFYPNRISANYSNNYLFVSAIQSAIQRASSLPDTAKLANNGYWKERLFRSKR
jgi:hypothetical protein